MGSRGSVIPFFLKRKEKGTLPITDERMTRFWITLDEGVEFVVKNFSRMQGGEIFVPKIPSIRITDLVTAMSGKPDHKVIGIRPGEKLHEVLCPEETARDTIEFKDHYVIRPFQFDIKNLTEKRINKYKINKNNEKGKFVKENFVYGSNTNPHFLSIKEIKKLT